ncbi:MAG TPA: VOC family protein [Solirubrobacteraceae bacterium]
MTEVEMSNPVQITPSASIASDTTIGAVSLTVSDLARSRDFYERVIGLRSFDLPNGAVSVGVTQDDPMVELFGDSTAPPLNRRAPGLFHMAILLPSRLDLAFALLRLADAHWPLDGASDHLVSEALYLSDPDGIGIEIYRDKPRDEWIRTDGQLQMPTEPLDLEGLIGEISGAGESQPRAPTGTSMGHVHLQVSSLRETEGFYHGVLGFDVTVRSYPGAIFFSAGGYHHHIGANVWHSAGSAPASPGAIGLRSFEIVLPGADQHSLVLDRVRAADIEISDHDSGRLIRDPSGNGVSLRTA